jgi:TetR/AcrR family transcriptional regulator, cholesterol catabolism regulator
LEGGTVAGGNGRRDQILAQAAALFASKGVASTTVREIADEVGILSGSLYHHFESKEAMVDEIISSYLEDLRGRYKLALAEATDSRGRLHAIIKASLETAAAHPHATEIYQNDANYLRGLDRFAYLKNVGREVQNTWLGVIQAGMNDGTFRPDIEAKIVYRLIRDATWLSVRWFKPTSKYTLEKFIDDCTSTFLDGLAGRGR